MSPLKLKNPETEQKTKDCLKILNDLKDDLGSWSKVAKRIGVNKVTVIRWINTKVIRECYQNLIPHLYSDERLIENPNSNVLSIDEAFGILNEWHIRYKSWGRISIKIGVPKRTIKRWRATRKIGKEYLKLIHYLKQKENLPH